MHTVLADLIASEGVVEDLVLRGQTGVMALHGGLEAGTAEAARACARKAGASLYVVEQPEDIAWHIPSTQYDPGQSAKLKSFLEHVRLSVSIHGFGRRGFESTVLVGGRNEPMRARVSEAIRRRTAVVVHSDPEEVPSGLRGLHPRNPVNLVELGGVQIELGPELRSGPVIDGIVDAVAVVLAAEQASICARP